MVGLNHDCFADCVNNFADSKLSDDETKCIQSCAARSVGQHGLMGSITQKLDARYGDRL